MRPYRGVLWHVDWDRKDQIPSTLDRPIQPALLHSLTTGIRPHSDLCPTTKHEPNRPSTPQSITFPYFLNRRPSTLQFPQSTLLYSTQSNDDHWVLPALLSYASVQVTSKLNILFECRDRILHRPLQRLLNVPPSLLPSLPPPYLPLFPPSLESPLGTSPPD